MIIHRLNSYCFVINDGNNWLVTRVKLASLNNNYDAKIHLNRLIYIYCVCIYMTINTLRQVF